jgi:hypothetical protein
MNVSTISTTVNVIKVPYIVPSHVRAEIGTLAVASSLVIYGFVDSRLSSFQILNIEIIEWIASTFLAWNPSRDRFEVLLSLRSLTWMAGILRSKKKSITRGKITCVKGNFVTHFLEEQRF